MKMMKTSFGRTKVVLRHLPPAISQTALVDQIDSVFAGRYNWFFFRSGKNSSQKRHSYSRAYLDFSRPEDVIEFAELFDGHVFVNEKGIQFKSIVEYAPSQRVPVQWFKKDGREGTIFKDSEYLEFLQFLEKPAENLPSAEIQLERREAERAGAGKDTPIITPLMDFVRQRRASKGGARRSLLNGKSGRRAIGSSSGNSGLASSKRGSDEGRNSTKMYVLRDATKRTNARDRSNYVLVSKQDDQQLSEKSIPFTSAAGTEMFLEESGIFGINNAGKKKVLLLKGKERETCHVSANMSRQQNVILTKNMVGPISLKQNQRCEGSGRIIRSILLNKDAHQSQSSAVRSDRQVRTSNLEKGKWHPRPQHVQLILKDTNGAPDYKIVGNDLHRLCCEKQDKRTRNKNRSLRGVWTPRQRYGGSFVNDELLSSSASQPTLSLLYPEGSHGDPKVGISNARSGETKTLGSGCSSYSSLDNGSYKHMGHCGPTNNVKDVDSSSIINEGKHSKRGGAGYGSHEKQVWVQKSSSGS
ncbi:regulator of nonsense transcripts UPF3 isoform X2 [Ziziphus jujuba]|uniref:Regulator of nonsense transcripts UPF3 isoform X2 n=1 Tax=Ziziphus jujuba TaxID=326968 RepID=A0A6P3ZDQ6_ZIZJJ|nr:regulator of nonsense transcripts UPF3 isoform X2 [Ziziphus jujuba]